MKTSQFKTSQFLGAVFLSILGVSSGAQAETYQREQTVHSTVSRAEVDAIRAQAVEEARNANAASL